MTTNTLPNVQVGSSSDASPELRERALTILRTEIDFIPNPEFRTDDFSDTKFVDATLADLQSSSNAPADLPAHLRRMCDSDLLTHEQETALFREMNYLKFRANSLRSRIDPDTVDDRAIKAIETLLQRAQTIRDHIIQSNTRLVMSIVKKFVTPQQSFDEMLSDGIFTLMQAVEKFDYDRGFRFSTYAYRSIARNAYRTVTTARNEEARFTRDAEEWAFEQEDDQAASGMADQVWGNLRELTASMLEQLDRRERFIIRSRYALGAHRKVRTFQCLADKLGVSKERVRQLEQRAVAKLRTMAAEFDIDDLFSAAMA
ncbi:MAG: sigma-70 family RNA polymerase sigma factor [Planctomycetaceae bacterium]|nr:sigma-70 family RNA polymerase sigma factor [Planctomycetales bacterium]MCB9920614.1 sigma-70 family RNA polymerase sigma factor [Planctomycetaceae bacterium]